MKLVTINLDKFRETLVTEPSGMTDRIEVSLAIERSAVAVRFKPGDEVFVVERDEDDVPCEVSAYMFLASIDNQAVILTPYINDLDDIYSTVDYHIGQTRDNYDTALAVFPLKDCYREYNDAADALEAEGGNDP